MFPLYDENRSRTRPYVTWTLIIINVIVFLWQFERGLSDFDFINFGEIPIYIMRGKSLYTLITSMFMHGGIVHILGNMVYLFIFGDNIEDRFGHVKYLVIYLIFGVVSGLTHSWFSMQLGGYAALIPAVGASGAISGILGAYVLLYPNARIVTVVFLGFFMHTRKIRSMFFLGFWIILQFLQNYLDPFGGVAYWAHIGGFIIGFIVAIPFKIIKTRKQRNW